jgi:SRSO17 transposase
VAFQHCGLTGDVRNCQTTVMLTYATTAGHAFLDRRLYLPEEWAEDRERCRAAGIPDEVGFATKPEPAVAAGVPSRRGRGLRPLRDPAAIELDEDGAEE